MRQESEFAMYVAGAARFKQRILQKMTGKTSIGKNELRDMLDEVMEEYIAEHACLTRVLVKAPTAPEVLY